MLTIPIKYSSGQQLQLLSSLVDMNGQNFKEYNTLKDDDAIASVYCLSEFIRSKSTKGRPKQLVKFVHSSQFFYTFFWSLNCWL